MEIRPRDSSHARHSCRGCSRTWTGYSEAHCPTCHVNFSVVRNFDLHRQDGQCIPPGQLINKKGQPVLKEVQRSGGTCWVSATGYED